MATLEPALTIDVRLKAYAAVAGSPARDVIRDLRIDLARGEFACLLGPSGCGKTSLLNLIAGLDRDYVGGVELHADAGGRMPRLAYVFQAPRLLPWRTVAQNLQLAVTSAGVSGETVPELLNIMGVSDTLPRYPGHLSTGMQRRVALVRAFAIEPDVLLMDEPLVSLDRDNAERIRALLLEVWQRRRSTVLFVTHDVEEAVYLADRIIELTPSPTRVGRDLSVDIERGRRDDEGVVRRFRLQHFPAPARN